MACLFLVIHLLNKVVDRYCESLVEVDTKRLPYDIHQEMFYGRWV